MIQRFSHRRLPTNYKLLQSGAFGSRRSRGFIFPRNELIIGAGDHLFVCADYADLFPIAVMDLRNLRIRVVVYSAT